MIECLKIEDFVITHMFRSYMQAFVRVIIRKKLNKNYVLIQNISLIFWRKTQKPNRKFSTGCGNAVV